MTRSGEFSPAVQSAVGSKRSSSTSANLQSRSHKLVIDNHFKCEPIYFSASIALFRVHNILWSIGFAKESGLPVQWPNHWSFVLRPTIRSGSLPPVRSITFCLTASLVAFCVAFQKGRSRPTYVRLVSLVVWSPNGDTRGPSIVFEAVDDPCPGPFQLSHIADYVYDFCPLSDPAPM